MLQPVRSPEHDCTLAVIAGSVVCALSDNEFGNMCAPDLESLRQRS